MDYVDYKMHIKRYSQPYDRVEDYAVRCLLYAVSSYCEYRTSSIKGELEYKWIRHYAVFLYHYATLENLCTRDDVLIDHRYADHIEFSVIKSAVGIVFDYIEGKIDIKQALTRCLTWVRCSYPLVCSSRVFGNAISDSRRWLLEKYGY